MRASRALEKRALNPASQAPSCPASFLPQGAALHWILRALLEIPPAMLGPLIYLFTHSFSQPLLVSGTGDRKRHNESSQYSSVAQQ